MTNELGTTLQDIEAKAERKREAEKSLNNLRDEFFNENWNAASKKYWIKYEETIRKYIEEN